MSKVIRFILTLALIYGAYTETGVFTALSLLLIFVAIELNSWLTQRAADLLSRLAKWAGLAQPANR